MEMLRCMPFVVSIDSFHFASVRSRGIFLNNKNYCHKKLTLFFFPFVYDRIKFFNFDKDLL